MTDYINRELVFKPEEEPTIYSEIMENVTLIAAVDLNRGIGKNGNLLYRFKEDMKFFKDQTMGKPMAMGYNTFYSLRGGKPLPERQHIVLTSKKISEPGQITVVRSVDELLKFIKDYRNEVMIIGGEQLYNAMIHYANKLILTEINAIDNDADTFFPDFKNLGGWNCEQLGKEQEENAIKYKHMVYTRK